MRRPWPVLAAVALAVAAAALAPAGKGFAGPDCVRHPNAGPCQTPTPTSPTPTPTPTPTGGGLVPPVDRTCGTDVTAALNGWLATVPDGATVDLAGGCYLVNGTVALTNRNGLTIDGGGATIRAATNAPDFTNRAQLALDLGANITVRNVTLRGTNTSADCAQPGGVSCYDSRREWDHNLRVTGTNGVLVDHVTFQHAWGDAVSVSPGGQWDSQGVGAVMARSVTVQNSSVDTTGRMAFACTGCHNFTVQDNTITNVGYHVVDVEVEAPAWTGDVTLLRNTYSNVYLALLSSTTGSGSARGPFVVRDNVHTDGPVACGGEINIGVQSVRSGPVTVTGNTLRSYLQDVDVTNAESATVTGNTGQGGGGGCGVNAGATVTDTGTALVTGNTFTNSAQVAVLTRTPGVVCGNSLNGSPYDQPVAC